MLMERMRSPSIYLEEPLRDLTRAVVPKGKFTELPIPLLVNTVDLERGAPVIWGTPGLQDVYVQDAVYASCALPGYFPPGRVGDRLCVDGGVVDNLPVAIAALAADLIIAVDVGSTDLRPINDAMSLGFANIYMRAATTMMHALQQFPLTNWNGPPMVLIRPRCGEDWLSFTNIGDTITEGHRAARKALEDIDAFYDQPGGVYPRRRFEIGVDCEKCIGCGLCVALAPNLMGMGADGKAYTRTKTVDWSPADGDFVNYCPTHAISARKIERIVPMKAGERGAA
jgi:NTE family protein